MSMLSSSLERRVKWLAEKEGLPPEQLVKRWADREDADAGPEEPLPGAKAGQVLDQIGDKILLLDPDHQIRYVNQRLAGVLDTSPGDLIGTSIQTLSAKGIVSSEAIQTLLEAIGRVRGQAISEERVEVPVRLADGDSPRQWEIRINMLGPGEETVILVARDETERAGMEERLREQESRLRGLVHSIPGVVFQFYARPDGTRGNYFVSEHAREVLGISPDPDRFYERVLEQVPDSHQDELLASIEEAIDERKPWDQEMPFRKPSGERIWLRGLSTPTEREGELIFNGVLLDITARKTYERQLIEAREEARSASRMKSALLENMSHEVRTPLTSVIGFADLLAEKLEDPLRAHAQTIQQGGERLKETLDTILRLAQLEGGELELQPQQINAGKFVRQAVWSFESEAQRKGLSFQTEGLEAKRSAVTDPRALTRITTHLVRNAITFTKEGTVRVSLEATEEELVLTVGDTGPGISEETQERIFEPFYQATSGYNREHEGTGLGLTIVRHLTELAGGAITLESEPGEGTVVTAHLPRNLEEEPSAEPTSGRQEKNIDPLPSGTRVLVVEDDASMRELVGEMLPDSVRLSVAAGPEEALGKIRDESFDVALLDINLKAAMNGVDLLGHIRSETDSPGPKAIAMTAYATHGDEESFRAEGFDGYLAKPFTKETLRKNLIQVVETARSNGASAEGRV